MGHFINLVGDRFDRLVVISRVENSSKGHPRWACRCDCGQEVTVEGASLRGAHTKSCGCKKRENAHSITHGKSKTVEYQIWRGMISRCENPKVERFPSYGGDGITVCRRWRHGDDRKTGFEYFIADMGERPPGGTLERKDPTANYEPSNTRWATSLEQANNKRNTRWVLYRGVRMSLCDAVRAAGGVIHYEAAAVRIKTGRTVDRAVETPSSRAHNAAPMVAL